MKKRIKSDKRAEKGKVEWFVEAKTKLTYERISEIVSPENFSESKKMWRFDDFKSVSDLFGNPDLKFKVYYSKNDGPLMSFNMRPKHFNQIKSRANVLVNLININRHGAAARV